MTHVAAMFLALGGDGAAALSAIGFRRLPYLAPAPAAAAAAAAAAAVPVSTPMEGMGRLVDLGSGGRLSLERAAQLPGRPQIARPADDGDRLGWTVAMVRTSQSATSAAAGCRLAPVVPHDASLLGPGFGKRWDGALRAVHGANDDSDKTGSGRCARGGGGGSGPHGGAPTGGATEPSLKATEPPRPNTSSAAAAMPAPASLLRAAASNMVPVAPSPANSHTSLPRADNRGESDAAAPLGAGADTQ